MATTDDPVALERRTARRHGRRAATSLAPAIVPLALALGVALGESGLPTLLSWLTAPLLVAGGSQVVLVGQLDSGASALSAAVAAVVINGRFALYGAALADRFREQPAWFRWLGPHYIVDQTYALVMAELGEGPGRPSYFRTFFATSGTVLWCLWTFGVGVGVLAAPVVPGELPLEFLLPVMFVALLVPGLRTRAESAMVLVGALAGAAALGPTAALVVVVAAALVVVPTLGRDDEVAS